MPGYKTPRGILGVGSGTANRLARWTDANTLGVSLLSDDATNVTLTSGQLLLPAGTLALPVLARSTSTNTGLFFVTTSAIQYSALGTATVQFDTDGIKANTFALDIASQDVLFARDSGQMLARRNGTAAQLDRIYNTFTDASNYERFAIDWITTANVLRLATEAAGTGTVRNIALMGGNVGIGTTGPNSILHASVTGTAAVRGILSAQYNTGVQAAQFLGRKARGTEAAPTTVVSGDLLGALVAEGHDGTNYLQMAAIQLESIGTIAATRVPTRITFWTGTDAAPSVLTERWRITEAGHFIGATDNVLDIGASGATRPRNLYVGTDILPNSTVSRLGGASNLWARLYMDFTNTLTVGAVTIDKPTGRVRIAAAGTSVVVTNSLVTAATHVFAVMSNGDATGRVTSVVPAAGSFTINTVAVTAEATFDFMVFNSD